MPDPLTIWLGIRALPWKLIGYAALTFAILALFAHDRITLAQNGKLKVQLSACSQGRQDDRTAYEQAQKQAAEQNRLQVEHEIAVREKINVQTKSDYSRDLARLRAEFMRNHSQSAPGGSQAGPVPEASPGADGPSTVQVPSDLILYGAETELKLMHLQNWVREQAGVTR